MGTNITGIGNANAIGFKSRVTGGIYFPPELKDALVGVWSAYGKSNDSTDRNIIKNKIKDRGGDFVISNAAFKLNSGFGKYEEDFTDWRIYPNIKVTDNVITTNGNFNSTWFIYKHSSESKINEINIKVSGIPKGGKILYFYISDETDNLPIKYTIPKDGIYHLPESKINNNRVSVGFTVESRYDWNNIRIEQIPSFEGAFVTDGKDDFITSTKTVQEMLGGSNEITVVSMIHLVQTPAASSEKAYTNQIRTGQNYLRNYVTDNGKTGIYGYTCKGNNVSVINNILGDKNDYTVENKSWNNLAKFSVIGYEDNGTINELDQVAWYWTIIANKVLTTDQINQVIAYYNLDKYVKPDIYYNVKKQGLTNDTPDEDWYLKDFSGNGRDMTLYNYARTPESGINEEGGLQSDGVVDYGQFVGDLGLKDYTVVIDRAYNNLINNQVPLISSNIVEDRTPFIVEHWNTGSNAISFSYGASRTTDIPLDINKKIVYQSTYSYMGYVIPKGNAISTGNGITLGKFGNGVQYSAICLWSLMLFPYSMSEFLIERQLKKYKLGTLYPNMVEFRPIIKANANYKITYYQIDSTNTWKSIKVGDYIVIGAKLAFQITFDNDASELKEVVSPQLSGIIVEKRPSNPGYNIYSYITSKSPQKINITIDEYIRFEDIVQPYPVFYEFTDENRNLVTWGSKIKVGSTITRIKAFANSNLLKDLYNISYPKLNGVASAGSKYVVERQMVFTCTATWTFDNNEPKCILSPRLLSIPNSSYKILGYIPDISGHGNNGVIHNSAYAEGSGVNEDGSFQFDGVDDFVDIPTLSSGGKQVLMKTNWLKSPTLLYDQRASGSFAILTTKEDDATNPRIAYQARNQDGKTYIDGIENNYIETYSLKGITHNITVTNPSAGSGVVPVIGANTGKSSSFAKMALYDFMLFDEVSTNEEIKQLNDIVGIEGNYVQRPPYYWDAYGKTNSDDDRSTIQQRGTAVGDYDLTNSNFAYEGMSGYNGYPVVFGANKTWEQMPTGTFTWNIDDNKLHITKALIAGNGLLFSYVKLNGSLLNVKEIPSFKIKVSGLEGKSKLWYRYLKTEDAISETTVVLENGTHELPKSYIPSDSLHDGVWIGFTVSPISEGVKEFDCDITIEVLPEYENGLVYDGVDDYSKNENIPVLTDYTYIYKRTIINIPTNATTLLKGADKTNGGAFIADYGNKWQFNFGQYNTIQGIADGINWQTVNSFNGTSINKGKNTDDSGITVAKFSNGYTSMVFYKLILYPKTISLLEINFLKNLMEKDEIIDLNNPIFIQE